jgi:MscS family membrane protein
LLELPEGAHQTVSRLLQTVVIFGLVLLAYAFWDAASDRLAGRKIGDDHAEKVLVPMATKFVRALIFIIGVLVALAFVHGVNVTAVVASLGIGGLVVALAAKDSVENLFGSITILFDMPFGIGDWVRVGDVDGVVEEINLRSTRIRTFEDSIITLPNSNLIKAHVENMGRRRYRRVRTVLGLEYATTPEKMDQFCDRIREMLRDHPKVRPGFERCAFNDFADSSLNVLLYTYIETRDYNEELALRHGLMMEIMRIAREVGVSFAFPTRTLHMMPPGADDLHHGEIQRAGSV